VLPASAFSESSGTFKVRVLSSDCYFQLSATVEHRVKLRTLRCSLPLPCVRQLQPFVRRPAYWRALGVPSGGMTNLLRDELPHSAIFTTATSNELRPSSDR
jgi:hypothetical protein